MPFTSDGSERKKSMFKGSPEGEAEDKAVVVDKKRNETIENIEDTILAKLGIPPTFLKMETTPVGSRHFRSNVVCSEYKVEAITPTISRPHSYYVTHDLTNGNLKFTPELERKYEA